MSNLLISDPNRRTVLYTRFLEEEAASPTIEILRALFEDIELLHEVLHRQHPTTDGLPDVYVRVDDHCSNAEGWDFANRIVITTGLINDAIRIGAAAYAVFRGAGLKMVFGEATVSKVFVLWTIAHEIVHLIRRHDLMESHFGSARETRHALEYDADMCATAAVFRVVEQLNPDFAPIECKLATLQGLFWPLRLQAERESDFEGSESHPPLLMRLLDVPAKLAMTHRPGYEPDPDFIRLETTNDHETLLKKLFELERIYIAEMARISGQPTASTLARFIRAGKQFDIGTPRARKWDDVFKVLPAACLLSRDEVPNDATMIIVGDAGISVPSKRTDT